jgi:predicted PurR-regulated permease PerM
MQVVAVEGSSVPQQLLGFIGSFLGGLLETVVILFFLLMAGDTFLRRLVEILPDFRNKRQAVEISQQIESDISVYLMTITLMNVGVGVLSGLAAWLCHLGDPILWGTLAFLLNFVPVLGPTTGVVIFLVAGLLSFDTLWQAALPAALYLGSTLSRAKASRRGCLRAASL